MTNPADEAAIAVVRRNTEEVQGKGNWEAFDELFADDFVDHTPQPGATPDKAGVAVLAEFLGRHVKGFFVGQVFSKSGQCKRPKYRRVL